MSSKVINLRRGIVLILLYWKKRKKCKLSDPTLRSNSAVRALDAVEALIAQGNNPRSKTIDDSQ